MGRYMDHDVPNDAHAFIGTCMGQGGVRVVAYTPSGGWVVVGKSGQYKAEGIPQDCFTTLQGYLTKGFTVRTIAFPPAGGDSWVIVADEAYEAHGIPQDCFDRIVSFVNGGSRISCVAFPPSGGDSWVVVADDALYAHDIDDYCFQTLRNYTQGLQPATQVTFGTNGGWVIYGGHAYWASNLDQTCFGQIETFQDEGWLVEQVAFTRPGGWTVVANDPVPSQADPLRAFEGEFFQSGSTWENIYQRMSNWGVPGASVALVRDNQIAWRTSYGVLQAGQPEYVYWDTPFQAGSVSKPHASIAVQVLARQYSIDLGDAVGKHTSWPVAVRSCASSTWKAEATIARVLQHKGGFVGRGNTFPLGVCTGFNGDGGGFGGYADTAGVSIPTLDEILAGTSPANSPAIEITTPPGDFYYSGMGYVVLMRMLQDRTGSQFASCVGQHVLTPLGMTASTFELTLPPALSRAAAGHDTHGQPIPGLRNRYPESPAAGLYTNAGDLCQTLIMLNDGGKAANGNQILTTVERDTMLTEGYGIFTTNPPSAANYFYSHNGENYGFTSLIQGWPHQKTAIAIMTNRDNGDNNASAFYTEVLDAAVRAYGIQT